jgi:hypothetical protein
VLGVETALSTADPRLTGTVRERLVTSSGRIARMESKLAKQADLALVAATQRLTPEERLNAFLTHCRLIMDLYVAGRNARNMQQQRR